VPSLRHKYGYPICCVVNYSLDSFLGIPSGLSRGETHATVLFAAELQRTGSVTLRNIQMEEYVAHGTIIMQSVPVGKSLVRSIQVQKMRESDSDRMCSDMNSAM
jgi:hypothetical protein